MSEARLRGITDTLDALRVPDMLLDCTGSVIRFNHLADAPWQPSRLDFADPHGHVWPMVKLARWTAWSLVAALILLTLSPIEMRPVVTGPTLERAAAYGLLGLIFALAYPRHRLLALVVVVVVAGGLELGQVLTASRHGRLPDFAVKAVSAGLGVLAAHVALTLQARLGRRAAQP